MCMGNHAQIQSQEFKPQILKCKLTFYAYYLNNQNVTVIRQKATDTLLSTIYMHALNLKC